MVGGDIANVALAGRGGMVDPLVKALARVFDWASETFRVPSPMSKILDGVAWLAASHGSTLEDVIIIVVIIVIINIGCHDRTEL